MSILGDQMALAANIGGNIGAGLAGYQQSKKDKERFEIYRQIMEANGITIPEDIQTMEDETVRLYKQSGPKNVLSNEVTAAASTKRVQEMKKSIGMAQAVASGDPDAIKQAGLDPSNFGVRMLAKDIKAQARNYAEANPGKDPSIKQHPDRRKDVTEYANMAARAFVMGGNLTPKKLTAAIANYQKGQLPELPTTIEEVKKMATAGDRAFQKRLKDQSLGDINQVINKHAGDFDVRWRAMHAAGYSQEQIVANLAYEAQRIDTLDKQFNRQSKVNKGSVWYRMKEDGSGNVVADMQDAKMVRPGQEQEALNEGYRQFGQPGARASSGTSVNVHNYPKPPAGYMWNDPSDPSGGLSAIPGGPAEKRSAESVGKEQMLKVAADQLSKIDELLFNEDGSINRVNVGTASAGVPWTDGRQMRVLMEPGIQGITRLETGAAMPEQEVDNTRERFQPSLFDLDETIILKREMFGDFINGALDLFKKGRDGESLPEIDDAKFDAAVIEYRARAGDDDGAAARYDEIKSENPDVTEDEIYKILNEEGW